MYHFHLSYRLDYQRVNVQGILRLKSPEIGFPKTVSSMAGCDEPFVANLSEVKNGSTGDFWGHPSSHGLDM